MSRRFPLIVTQREAVPDEMEVSIKEYRAPTDDSISLLNEMEEKVLSNIIKKIRIEDNTMNCIILYHFIEVMFDNARYVVKFTFNGKEYSLEGTVDHKDISDASRFGSDKVAVALMKGMALLIAEEVLKASPDVLGEIKKSLRLY